MKPLSIELNDPAEAFIIEKAVIMATGQKCKIKPARYIFISEDFKIQTTNEDIIYQRRIEHKISVLDALEYLNSLVNNKPFLTRDGLKVSPSGKIDQGIKEQFSSMCRRQGYKIDDRLENLIAADIKCRIHGIDLLEAIKEVLNDNN